jgi:SAM-dependent methyltransferase
MTQYHNRRAWDELVRKRQRFTRPAPDKDFSDPLAVVDGIGWLGGDIRGKRLLCLAAGGGKHSALYAAAGADVTVVDLSPAMLELDRQVAAERKLAVRTIEASMDDMPALAAGEFDIVIHPVSTCYVPDLAPVYREVARVTRPGGLYISSTRRPRAFRRTWRRRRADMNWWSRTIAADRCRRLSAVRTVRRGRLSTCIAGRSCWAFCAGPDL